MARKRTNPIVLIKAYRPGRQAERLVLDEKLTSFSYDEDEEKADKITIQIDNYDLLQFDNPLWNAGTIIEVSFGYPDNMSKPRGFHIESLRGFHTLTIEAVSMLGMANKVAKTRTFENMKKKDIVRAVWKEVYEELRVAIPSAAVQAELSGISMDLDPGENLTDLALTRNPSLLDTIPTTGATSQQPNTLLESADPLPQDGSSVDTQQTSLEQFNESINEVTVQSQETDYQFMRRLAKQEGKILYSDSSGLHYKKRDYGQKPYKKYTYMRSLVEGDILTIDVTQSWLGKKDGKKTVETFNPATGKVETHSADGGNTKRDTLAKNAELTYAVILADGTSSGPGSVQDPNGGDNSRIVSHVAKTESIETTNTNTAKDAAENKFKDGAQNALELSMRLVGDPQFIGKTIIELECDAKRLSRKYYVKRVKHHISPAGYTMDLSCTTDVGTQTGAAKANTQKVDDNGGPGVVTSVQIIPSGTTSAGGVTGSAESDRITTIRNRLETVYSRK